MKKGLLITVMLMVMLALELVPAVNLKRTSGVELKKIKKL